MSFGNDLKQTLNFKFVHSTNFSIKDSFIKKRDFSFHIACTEFVSPSLSAGTDQPNNVFHYVSTIYSVQTINAYYKLLFSSSYLSVILPNFSKNTVLIECHYIRENNIKNLTMIIRSIIKSYMLTGQISICEA